MLGGRGGVRARRWGYKQPPRVEPAQLPPDPQTRRQLGAQSPRDEGPAPAHRPQPARRPEGPGPPILPSRAPEGEPGGGEGSDPWGLHDQAHLRRSALAPGSLQEGVGEQGALCSLLSQASAQPRAARGAAPAQGPGKRILGPPMARLHPPQRRHIGCRTCSPKKMGILPLSSTGSPARWVVLTDTQGADVLEPSLHWGRQLVGADVNLACPMQEAHSRALLRSQELGM